MLERLLDIYRHHKHVRTPSNRQPSTERSLEEVLDYILTHLHMA